MNRHRQDFVSTRFTPSSRQLLRESMEIVDDFTRHGHPITLKQLFYQLVVRGHIAGSRARYDVLQDIIRRARLGGDMDWGIFTDWNAFSQQPDTHRDAASALSSLTETFRVDLWEDQPYYIEVWSNRRSTLGALAPALRGWRLPSTATLSRISTEAAYERASILRRRHEDGKRVLIMIVTDHTPSGRMLAADLVTRMLVLSGGVVEFEFVALSADQARGLNAPTAFLRPAEDSWEIDALHPEVVVRLLDDAIEARVDHAAWTAALDRETKQREILRRVVADV